jgi:hypothetical protein
MLGIALVVLLALLVACGGNDEPDATASSGDQPAAATATSADAPATATKPEQAEADDDPTATVADTAPTATEQSEDAGDDATATAEPSGDRLVGSASVDDDKDDVVNLLMQEPDDPMPGIDLVNVRIEGDGTQIVATIETAGDIEAQLSDDVDVSFDVHLWQDDKPAYALSFHHNGSDNWEATITDFSAGLLGDEDDVDTDIHVSGNTLSAAFPVDMLADLEDSFQWYSSVMLSEGGMAIGPNSWFDGAPENVIQLLAEPDEFVEFPQ